MARSWIRASILLALLLGSSSASATYSIVAANTRTGQVGAAAASCVADDITFIYGSSPGRGAVVAQAYFHEPGRNLAVQLIGRGVAPPAILTAITDKNFDEDMARRQYGIADLDGRSATYTGALVDKFAGGRQGRAGDFAYGIQGNFISGDPVLSGAEAGFRSLGCDFADRLMMALEAGARDQGGDARCLPNIPATSAFLRVDRADGTPHVNLAATITTGESALVDLRRQYDGWRLRHPCAKRPAGCGCRIDGDGSAASICVLWLAVIVALRCARRTSGSSRKTCGRGRNEVDRPTFGQLLDSHTPLDSPCLPRHRCPHDRTV